ncbi:MAG: DUF4124 domain-containing protein [Gammaproteobacteria bacterium]
MIHRKVKLIVPRFTLACLLLVLASGSQAAGKNQIYKWIDDQGEVHYSQRVPAGKTAQQIKGAPPPADSPDALNENLRQQVDAMDERLASKDEAAVAARKQAENEKIIKQNCATARKNLAALQQGANKAYMTPDGKVARLTEEDRQQRISDARGQIKKYCSP